MQIRKAEENDFDAVRNFYHSMIDAMEGTPFHPKWQKDIYPSRADLKTAIDEQGMYIGVLGDKIASAMVFNHKCSEEYSEAAWPNILTKEQFAVIHMLGVHSVSCDIVDTPEEYHQGRFESDQTRRPERKCAGRTSV